MGGPKTCQCVSSTWPWDNIYLGSSSNGSDILADGHTRIGFYLLADPSCTRIITSHASQYYGVLLSRVLLHQNPGHWTILPPSSRSLLRVDVQGLALACRMCGQASRSTQDRKERQSAWAGRSAMGPGCLTEIELVTLPLDVWPLARPPRRRPVRTAAWPLRSCCTMETEASAPSLWYLQRRDPAVGTDHE